MTMILYRRLVLSGIQAVILFFSNLKILLTWKRSRGFVNRSIVYYHLVRKLIISHDVMGKHVSCLKQILATDSATAGAFSKAAASLSTDYRRQSVYLPLL